MKMLRTLKLFDLQFVNASMGEVVEFLSDHVENGSSLLTVFTPNPEQIIWAEKDPAFAKILQKGNLLLPDGEGIVWASKVKHKKGQIDETLKERISGVDVVQQLLSLEKNKNWKMGLIGGFYNNEVELGKIASAKRLKLRGFQSDIYWLQGYQNVMKIDQNETKVVQNFISVYKPHILYVALGAPWQEKWVMENKEFLQQNGVKMVMVVGGTFDFLTGKLKRAPTSWRKLKLEWLYRLLQEPKRWQRQLALPKFVGLVFRNRK